MLLPAKQTTETAHGAAVVRASRQEPRERPAAVSVVPVVGRRRRLVMAVMVAVAGLLLALDLVLDGVGHCHAGCTTQERLELAPVAHLVPDGAACTAADDRRHEALLAVLWLAWLAVIVWL